MKDTEFRHFLDLLMVSDPWPLSKESHDVLCDLADREAKDRSYETWIDAYHYCKAEVTKP